MVIKVGVCDDNPIQVEVVAGYLRSSSWADQLELIESSDPMAFLNLARKTRPQIVFLDIDMGTVNGIQVGQALKAMDEDLVLVYVTAHEKYAVQAFGVRAFHYLLKPLTRDSLTQVLAEGIAQVKKLAAKKQGAFVVKTKKEVVRLKYDEIYCFEKVGHRIRVRLFERDYFYYGNFTALLKELDATTFLQCHQGYIANISKIRGFKDKTLILDGGISLPVSRSYTDSVKQVLAEWLFD